MYSVIFVTTKYIGANIFVKLKAKSHETFNQFYIKYRFPSRFRASHNLFLPKKIAVKDGFLDKNEKKRWRKEGMNEWFSVLYLSDEHIICHAI